MKLIDLEPLWLSPDVFMFKSPIEGGDWITCKRIPMSLSDQWELADEKAPKDIPRNRIVPCKADISWKFQGNDFNTLTVTPSIDGSKSGNWHGFITNGEIK